MKTLYINKQPVCTYQIKGDSIFIKMWGRYDTDNMQERYIDVIKKIEDARPSRGKDFLNIQHLYIEKPIF